MTRTKCNEKWFVALVACCWLVFLLLCDVLNALCQFRSGKGLNEIQNRVALGYIP